MKVTEKPLTTIEKWSVALGLVFMVGGSCMVFNPKEGIVIDPARTTKWVRPARPELVSKTESRIYGGAAVAMGAGIVWLALFSRRQS